MTDSVEFAGTPGPGACAQLGDFAAAMAVIPLLTFFPEPAHEQ